MVAGTSLVTLAILLAGATSALAQYTTDPSPSPAAPSQGSTAGGAPSAACYRDERPSVNQSFTASANQSYTVELNSWAQPDGTCNDSVLAKLGDQCGTINDWKCDRADGSTDRLTFTTGSGARLGCVEDALSLASIGNGAPFQVKCSARNMAPAASCLRKQATPHPFALNDYSVKLERWPKASHCDRGLLNDMLQSCSFGNFTCVSEDNGITSTSTFVATRWEEPCIARAVYRVSAQHKVNMTNCDQV